MRKPRIPSHSGESASFGTERSDDLDRIDLDALRARKEKVIATLTGGLKQLGAKRKVNVVRAKARFENSQTLKLDPVDGNPLADLGPIQNAAISQQRSLLNAGVHGSSRFRRV